MDDAHPDTFVEYHRLNAASSLRALFHRLLLLGAVIGVAFALSGCSTPSRPKIDAWTFYDCYNAPPHFRRPTNCPPRSAFVTETDRQIRAGVARVQH